jgi:hypothetical protein
VVAAGRSRQWLRIPRSGGIASRSRKTALCSTKIEAGNTDGTEVVPETRSEIDRLKAQIAQSELIVAAYEKEHPGSWLAESLNGAREWAEPTAQPSAGSRSGRRRLVFRLSPGRVLLHQLDNRAAHRRVLDPVEGPQQSQHFEIFFLVVHHLSPSLMGRDTSDRADCFG